MVAAPIVSILKKTKFSLFYDGMPFKNGVFVKKLSIGNMPFNNFAPQGLAGTGHGYIKIAHPG